MWFDRYGARARWRRCRCWPALGSLWIATATDAADLIGGRAVVGVGCAASFMSAVFLCSRWFAPAKLATAMSWVFAASNIGTLAAATPLAWIAGDSGLAQRLPGLAAVTVLVALVAFYAIVRDRPPDQPIATHRRESFGEIVRGLLGVWTTPGLMPVLAMHFFAYATMLTVLGVWGGPYLYDVQARRRAAWQRAACHGRGADPGHPGLRTDGPPAALAQEGRAGRCRDIGGAAASSPCCRATAGSPSCSYRPSASSAPSAR